MYCAAFVHKYLQRGRSNLLFQKFDMGKGLLTYIRKLYAATDVPIVLLFQHPSPSANSKNTNSFATATNDCALALSLGLIKSVFFVFDHHKTKNCWTGKSIQALCKSKWSSTLKSSVKMSPVTCICEQDQIQVNHPVFGIVQRAGWAKMKAGQELSFCMY